MVPDGVQDYVAGCAAVVVVHSVDLGVPEVTLAYMNIIESSPNRSSHCHLLPDYLFVTHAGVAVT